VINHDFTDLQRELQAFTKQFAETELRPAVEKCVAMSGARKAEPETLLNSVMEIGLHTISVPEQNGGVGADRATECIVAEELARVDLGIASLLEQMWQSTRLLCAHSPETFHERYLSEVSGVDPYMIALVDDSLRGSIAVERNGDVYSLSGTAPAVVGAEFARYLLVVTQHKDDGVSPGRLLMMIPSPSIGANITPIPYIGQSLSGRMAIEFDHCVVPAENVHNAPIGPNHATMLVGAAAMVGTAQVAFDLALDYARLRRQGGDLLINHQALGNVLASLLANLEAARSLVWRSARDLDHATETDPAHQMAARLVASEVSLEVVTRSIEVFGGYGIMRDLPLGRYLGDLVVAINSDGSVTSQIDHIRRHLAEGF